MKREWLVTLLTARLYLWLYATEVRGMGLSGVFITADEYASKVESVAKELERVIHECREKLAEEETKGSNKEPPDEGQEATTL